jgi:hypothetical protein
MSLKLDRNQLIFKLNPDELRRLSEGLHIDEIINLGTYALMFEVRVDRKLPVPGAHLETLCIGRQMIMRLTVSPLSIQELIDLGRNRDGLIFKQGETTIYLQVDVKSVGRPSKSLL